MLTVPPGSPIRSNDETPHVETVEFAVGGMHCNTSRDQDRASALEPPGSGERGGQPRDVPGLCRLRRRRGRPGGARRRGREDRLLRRAGRALRGRRDARAFRALAVPRRDLVGARRRGNGNLRRRAGDAGDGLGGPAARRRRRSDRWMAVPAGRRSPAAPRHHEHGHPHLARDARRTGGEHRRGRRTRWPSRAPRWRRRDGGSPARRHGAAHRRHLGDRPSGRGTRPRPGGACDALPASPAAAHGAHRAQRAGRHR